MENRDKALRTKLKEIEKVFVHEKKKRDQDLLKMLEEKEKEIEKNLLQKADAFGYLYKAHQK